MYTRSCKIQFVVCCLKWTRFLLVMFSNDPTHSFMLRFRICIQIKTVNEDEELLTDNSESQLFVFVHLHCNVHSVSSCALCHWLTYGSLK